MKLIRKKCWHNSVMKPVVDIAQGLLEKLRRYHVELRHVLLLFIILAVTLLLLSVLQQDSLQNFLIKTRDAYQNDSAERIASLTTLSLETLFETAARNNVISPKERREVIENLNILFSQHLLLENVEEVCVLVSRGDEVYAIDTGQGFYDYFLGKKRRMPPSDSPHRKAIALYRMLRKEVMLSEEIHSSVEDGQTFHVLVPFVPNGEYAGVLYTRSSPDFTYVTDEIVSGYTKFTILFIGLTLLGLISMFYISSYSLRQRDRATELLYSERERQLEERIHHQKETLFAKRIYHTHHKAEKVMGFIKEDLRTVSEETLEEIKNRVTKYASFIARVIYDMKWFDPPLQTIRNPIFKTDVNSVIRFIVENICLRITKNSGHYRFELNLDDAMPKVEINEFVIWEILEPILQNSLEHNEEGVKVDIETRFDARNGRSILTIRDDGAGIQDEFLRKAENGVKKIFQENVSDKEGAGNSGYGCYLAYEIATQRCRWDVDVDNLPEGGCQFTITIPNKATEPANA